MRKLIFNDIKDNAAMNKNDEHEILKTSFFISRIARHTAWAFVIILISLLIGMYGYHFFEKMPWVDAYENAAMILSGMGPAEELKTEGGKIFAGTYALFSGIIFLFVMAIIFAPIFKRFLHKFHMEFPKKIE